MSCLAVRVDWCELLIGWLINSTVDGTFLGSDM